jgi:hypothetical protein
MIDPKAIKRRSSLPATHIAKPYFACSPINGKTSYERLVISITAI